MDYLKTSNIPLRYLKGEIQLIPDNIDLDKYQKLKEIKTTINSFVKTGGNLFIYSPYTGNGKTSWACKLMIQYASNKENVYFENNPIYFINVAELLNLKKNAMDDEASRLDLKFKELNIKHARLVTWDDIAVKGLSEFDQEYLYTLINYRVSNCKANIYTANICPDDLENLLGARLYSRIVNQSQCIKFMGGDKRNG